MQKVLVTGGAGYIGSHICKALYRKGLLPVCFDNLSRGHRHAVKWGPLFLGELSDSATLDEVIRAEDLNAVIHLAGYSYVGESVQDPLLYYHNNVAGAISLLRVLQNRGVKNVIFSSSAATYALSAAGPISENGRQDPLNPYGWTKLMVEKMLQHCSEAYGINYVSLRYFNACGADPEGEVGEEHEPETHLIPRALLAAIGKVQDFEIYGADYNTPDGTCIRDYIHVSDLARGHLLALQYLLGGGKSCELNIGSGRGYSVKEILNVVGDVTTRKVNIRNGKRRLGDPESLIADPRRAFEIIGFSPELSDIRTIVDSAWKFLISRGIR